MQNRLSADVVAPTRGYQYEPHRYAGMDDHAIAAQLHRFVGVPLLRGRLETPLARREIGGLLCEFAKHHPKDRPLFEAFALNTVGLSLDGGVATFSYGSTGRSAKPPCSGCRTRRVTLASLS